MTVTTAIIPAAGWGTRMLPASFSVPKELLPVFDRPSIEWVVAEAIASGIERIVLVSGRGKSGLMDHFDRHAQLEAILQASRLEQAEAIARRARGGGIHRGASRRPAQAWTRRPMWRRRRQR